MVMAVSARTKKQGNEMAKRKYIGHKKDIKVRGFVQLIRSAEATRLDITGRDRRARMHNRSGGEVVTRALLAEAAV